jgi:hypothetical protein
MTRRHRKKDVESPPLLIEYGFSSSPQDEEPNRFVTHILGHIFAFNESDRKERVGKLRLAKIDVDRALEERESLFDVFDADSQELHELSVVLFDFDAQELLPPFEATFTQNVLYGGSLEIFPKFRQLGISRVVVRDAIRNFGADAGVAILKAFPLNYEHGRDDAGWLKKMNAERLIQIPSRIAQRRLATHWRKVGFEPVPETDYFFMNLDYRHELLQP